MTLKIKRAHLYTADLNPNFGTEAGKVRPVLILQTDVMNIEHPSTLICPLTTKVRPEVEILRVHLEKGTAGLKQDSDILIDQIRAIDNVRLKKELGKLPGSVLQEVEEKISIVLGLR